MTTLLIGFDSAWTPTKSGALAGVLRADDGVLTELGPPDVVNYVQAERVIVAWQAQHKPDRTVVMLDQPTIVKNAAGQRPVENLVSSPVSLRYGGVQPAYTARTEMFGPDAPVWRFLARFGGPADPLGSGEGTRVFETYPVLAMIALEWTLPDARPTGRLPKYNPGRRSTFTLADWRHVCQRAGTSLSERGLPGLAAWLSAAERLVPRKHDQDRLDACLCLLAALHFAESRPCLMVGNVDTGYIVVPHNEGLHAELERRCTLTGRAPTDWVRTVSDRPSPRPTVTTP